MNTSDLKLGREPRELGISPGKRELQREEKVVNYIQRRRNPLVPKLKCAQQVCEREGHWGHLAKTPTKVTKENFHDR